MRKYAEVFRLSFKMQIIWRFDVMMTMVATVARIAAAWLLWTAIYQGRDTVGGLSFSAMLSYYVVAAIISSLDFSRQVSAEIAWLIKDGGFSKHLVTPLHPLAFFAAMTGGEAAFHLGFSCIAALVCALTLPTSFLLSSDPVSICLTILLILTGLLFKITFHYCIGIMAFRFLDIDFVIHIQDSVVAFATGALIPLALLPPRALNILRCLPFTHVVYTPAMLLTQQISPGEGLQALLISLFWTASMLLYATKTYTRLRVLYDGVGI